MAESVVIEIVGEGRTDSGRGGNQPERPTTGVVPIIVHRLCNQPEPMRIRRRPLPFLQGKGWVESRTCTCNQRKGVRTR